MDNQNITVYYENKDGDVVSKEIANTRLGDFLSKAAERGVKVHTAIPSDYINKGQEYSKDQRLETSAGAIAQGAAQGLSGGFVDEGAAKLRSLVGNATPDQELEAARAKRELAKGAHPAHFQGADVAGSLGLSVIGGGGKALAAALPAANVVGHADDKTADTAVEAGIAGALGLVANKAGDAVKGLKHQDGEGLGKALINIAESKASIPSAIAHLVLGGLHTAARSKILSIAGSLLGMSPAAAGAILESKDSSMSEEQKAKLYAAIGEKLVADSQPQPSAPSVPTGVRRGST